MSNTANAIRAAGDAAPSTPIEVATSRLRSAQRDTHELLDTLSGKLAGILPHPSPEKAGTGPMPVNAGESPLHGILIERVESAVEVNERLQRLIDTITL